MYMNTRADLSKHVTYPSGARCARPARVYSNMGHLLVGGDIGGRQFCGTSSDNARRR